LRLADLRFADVRFADLRSADLRFADLRIADLRFADLRFADAVEDSRRRCIAALNFSYYTLYSKAEFLLYVV